MKIIFSAAAQIPSRSAESIFVMKMCEAFIKNGHKVRLIAPQQPDTQDEVCNIFDYYGIKNQFQIKILPWMSIPGKRFFYALQALNFALKFKADLMYTRSLHTAFVCACRRFPMVYESHIPVADSGFINHLLFRIVLIHSMPKKMVVISQALKHHYMKKYRINESSIVAVHDAADMPEKVKPFSWSRNDRFKVGYVGHLYPGRGIKIIFELAKRCDWADFHCVGGLNKDVDFWARRSKGIPNLYFHGYVPFSETERYRQSFDVLIAPYQRKVNIYSGGDSAKWMSPLKIFEYMASEKPIITSDLPVLKEVLTDKFTALLCDPDDIESWHSALMLLRDNEDFRNKIVKSAKNIFNLNYSWQARTQNILSSLN